MGTKCKDCGLIYDGFDNHMVMLYDSCIERRLGRKLKVSDLKPNVPVNIDYHHKLK